MERAKRFFQRHRRGMAITAVIVGAGYLAYKYIREKVKEASEESSTERSDQEKSFHPSTFAKSKFLCISLRRRFIQNQQDCMFSVLALYPTMAQQILEELRVEPILTDLQQKRVAPTAGTNSVQALSTSDDGDSAARASMITTITNGVHESADTVFVTQKKSKTELWNELKVMSIIYPCQI
jgi:peroxin-3